MRLVRAEMLTLILGGIKEFGFTAEELGFDQNAGKESHTEDSIGAPRKRTRAPKYQDPLTGRTWTGAGRQPKWIVGNKAKYLINITDR
ncbi:H-NS histone family protein [Burkholderia sp. Leaf177]|uniref:H-NS histone family protein n=1 Tax=Burkholderia sp. Leaf177 TaxID=1736287 RepID=UPI001F48809D